MAVLRASRRSRVSLERLNWLVWLVQAQPVSRLAQRPDAFAESYEPLDAGEEACAFVRGGEVVACAWLRGDGTAPVTLPAGAWRDGHPRGARA